MIILELFDANFIICISIIIHLFIHLHFFINYDELYNRGTTTNLLIEINPKNNGE